MATATTVEVTLPAMGESVSEGTILEWHKAEGDPVEAGETLVEVSTDKVDAEVPSPVAGTLVKIHVPEGETIAVGEVIAEIRAGEGNGNGSSGETAAAPASGPAGDSAGEAAGREPQVIDIVAPEAGESVTEGTLLDWHVAPGDQVSDGQTVAEISTDKVDVELPAPASGTITEILAEAGETVTVGQVIARMAAGASPEANGNSNHPGDHASPLPVSPRVASTACPKPSDHSGCAWYTPASHHALSRRPASGANSNPARPTKARVLDSK